MRTIEATPTREDLLTAARSLQDCLREFADYGDTHRRTADEVIGALTEAGMFRLFTPRRYHGYEVDLNTLLDIAEILGEADGSAAWLVGIAAAAAWVAAHAPTQALDEVFGADPDARVAGGGTGVDCDCAGDSQLLQDGIEVVGRSAAAARAPTVTPIARPLASNHESIGSHSSGCT